MQEIYTCPAWAIGENLGWRLECAGMSLKDLHEATGVSYSTLSNYQRGLNVPNAVNLKKMATALGCTMDDLMEGVE